MTIVDHLMIILMFVVQPIYGAYAYRCYVARVEAGRAPRLVREYRVTMLVEWAALTVLMSAWLAHSRPLHALGFVMPSGTGFHVGAAMLLGASAYLVYEWRRSAAATPEERTHVVRSLGELRHFMPCDRRSYVAFSWLSLTAGVVEEALYRGFAFWYLGQFLPIWAVIVVSAIAFGLAHSYQGVSGMIRVTLIGVAFGAFYVLTGSIWLPMVAHVVLDLLQGATLLEYLRHHRGSDLRAAGTAEEPGA